MDGPPSCMNGFRWMAGCYFCPWSGSRCLVEVLQASWFCTSHIASGCGELGSCTYALWKFWQQKSTSRHFMKDFSHERNPVYSIVVGCGTCGCANRHGNQKPWFLQFPVLPQERVWLLLETKSWNLIKPGEIMHGKLCNLYDLDALLACGVFCKGCFIRILSTFSVHWLPHPNLFGLPHFLELILWCLISATVQCFEGGIYFGWPAIFWCIMITFVIFICRQTWRSDVLNLSLQKQPAFLQA